MKIFIAAFLHLFLLAGSAEAGRVVEGIVRAVYDGDTILLLTRRDSRLKVRLYGIDAPETRKRDRPGQFYGNTAKRALMYKVMGRRVTAEIVDIDRYKRAVAVIRYSEGYQSRNGVRGGGVGVSPVSRGALRIGVHRQ